MTSGAIDARIRALKILDRLKQIVVDGLDHLGHFTRNRFRRSVVLVPLIDDMTVRAIDPE